MKKYFYLLLVSLAAFMAASCSDELESDANDTAAVKSGQPICLINTGDETTNNGKKKLHYGEQNGTKWPVCWDVNDAADVLCPEARWSDNPHSEATDVPSVSYKITELTGTSGTIKKAGDKELCWGKANAHHFFQAFPAGAVDLSDVTKNKYGDNTNDYSANFTATISQSQVIPADSIKQDKDGNWTARNMNYAVLVGTDLYEREKLDEKEPIHLHYNTAFTAVEVTIGACGTGAFDGDVITAVDITNATTNNTGYTAIPLAGEFTGTVGYSGGSTYANNFANSTTPSKLFNNVRIDLSAKPVTLEANSGKTLKVTAFLLPTAGAQVKVTVNRRKIKSGTPGAPLTISKSFKSGSSDEKALAAGKVNQLGMGALPTTETNKIDGNNWMSVLPDETYLSEMSIPGVYDCAAYASNVADAAQAQTPLKKANGTTTIGDQEVGEQMMAYLRAGNRVFDFKLSSAYDNSGNVSFNITRMIDNTHNATFDFGEMVKGAQAWLYEHPTECVICVISDFNTEITHSIDSYYSSATSVVSKRNGKTYTYDAYDFKVNEQPRVDYNNGHELSPYEAGIKKFIEEETPTDLLLKKYDENLTLGEARGKVVIIDLSEYDDAYGCVVKDFVVNTHPSPTSWFQDTRTIENEIALTEHTFGNGKMYIQDFLNLQRRDTYNAGSWIRPDNKPNTIQGASRSGNFDFDITKKKGYLDAAFAQACGDTDHKNWYLISTAARGWVNSTSLTTLYYSNAATGNTYNINGYTKNIANNASSGGTYQRLGMVLNAFAGTETYKEGNTGTNRTLEQIIWENNYKGNGPLTKSSATE